MKGTIGSLLLVTFVLATGAAAQTNSISFASAELGVGHDPASHGIPDNQEISFASAWQSVHEGVGIASVTVTLSVPPPLSTVYGLTVGGTATRGVDYEFICNTLMRCDSRFHDSYYFFGFQKGQTAITIPVAIFADDVADSGETIELNLETATIHSIGTHTLTIVDGDGDGHNPVSTTKSISFASASQSVYEASSTANVTVNLHPSPETDLTFAYTVYGTAKPDSDYTIDNSGTLLVPAGAPTATIPVVIIDDSVEDSGETVVLTLFADNGYAVGANGTHTLTILNHDPKAVWRLPPASHPSQQGFVRVINRSAAAGEVAVTATDDAGREHEPLALRLEAHAAAHFSSGDLENGNAAKGLSGGTGPGMGGWRLEFGGGALDVEARGYVRSADGFLAAMHETAPRGADGAWRLLTFNPASNADQVSRLRLVNPTDAEAWATVTGVDDSGASPGAPVVLTLPAGATCEVDAAALESGRGLACGEPQAGLGDGAGKWRLSVASDSQLVALGLLSSPGGHLANLSGTALPDADGAVRVPLFPSASDPHGRQGLLRVANRSGRAGTVTIRAFDDSDVRYTPLRLRLEAREAKQINSDDLELGNRGKGLTGRTGAGTGAWRLELSSPLFDFEAGAYVRHRDGFLTAMQSAAPSVDGVHRVAAFNPGGNDRQVSVLRLVNRGREAALASVTGADDRGVRPGGAVEVTVPAGAAVELTAAELESGDAEAIASGALGDGVGKWRLRVASDGDLAVMGLLSSPMGRLMNLSGADRSRDVPPLPSLPPPPASVALEDAGGRRVRGGWSAVEGARYGVDLLLDGAPVEGASLARTTRTSFRWSGLEAGTYRLRVRSVDAGGQAGPWSALSNEVAID